jgi:membrane-anchored mycosin MYCP
MRMAVLKGRVERYYDDQMIVALPDLHEVQRVLDEFGLDPGHESRAEQLGLALLTLPRLAADIRRLRQDQDGADLIRAATAAWQADVAAGRRAGEIPDLDLLLLVLRGYFRERFSNWAPTMGKNNVVSHPGLAGDPHLRGGDFGDPGDPTVEPWPPREAQPGARVRVGLLDTRLWQNPWLAGAYTAAPEALIQPESDDSETRPATAGHATFVAGLILRRAPGAVLEVRAVLDAEALGNVWNAAKHMADLTRSGLDVLNVSLGCFTDDGQPPLALATAIGLMRPQTVVVAAAGNYGQADLTQGLTRTTPMWPAALDGVIAVGAADGEGKPAAFSPELPWIDFLAPGVDVKSTYLMGRISTESPGTEGKHAAETPEEFAGWARWSGTSFAAASVSGAIAARTEPGHRTAVEALDLLRKPSQSGPDSDIRPLP